MNNYNFINPQFFYLLAIPLVYLIWYFYKKPNITSQIVFSSTESLSNSKTLKIYILSRALSLQNFVFYSFFIFFLPFSCTVREFVRVQIQCSVVFLFLVGEYVDTKVYQQR